MQQREDRGYCDSLHSGWMDKGGEEGWGCDVIYVCSSISCNGSNWHSRSWEFLPVCIPSYEQHHKSPYQASHLPAPSKLGGTNTCFCLARTNSVARVCNSPIPMTRDPRSPTEKTPLRPVRTVGRRVYIPPVPSAASSSPPLTHAVACPQPHHDVLARPQPASLAVRTPFTTLHHTLHTPICQTPEIHKIPRSAQSGAKACVAPPLPSSPRLRWLTSVISGVGRANRERRDKGL